MDCSHHSVKTIMIDEEAQAVVNKTLKRLGHISDQLYEVKLAKSEIEHKEPIIVGFFMLQYAKLRMLELCYKFFSNICDTEKYEGLEMDTLLLISALSEKELYDCIRSEEK